MVEMKTKFANETDIKFNCDKLHKKWQRYWSKKQLIKKKVRKWNSNKYVPEVKACVSHPPVCLGYSAHGQRWRLNTACDFFTKKK